MKKIISILLSAVMLCLCLPIVTVSSSAADLPSSATLVGTQFLPPVSNQGAVGCCASEAIAYLQFTNAVARYKYYLDPNTDFKPSTGNPAYCMSPRFTYNLAGAGTAWVYEILKEQGTVPQSIATFSGGVTGYASDDALAKNWAAAAGNWDIAQQYRISNYDQVWIGNSPYNYRMTTSNAGRALIDRIKSAINDGNVVVTGGYPDRWVTDLVQITSPGTLGKKYEAAIPYSRNVSSGGHQVAIVGYDDNITCVKNGVTLKGAFLVQNSWGMWQNNGRIWMMYDALNEVSEYDALNVEGRTWTMDQMCFLDWRTDLNLGTPDLTANLTVTTGNEDGFSVTLTRTDRTTGQTAEYTPYMMEHMSYRSNYNQGYNFVGSRSGNAVTGILTFNYDNLINTMASGKSVDDYIWGMKVSSCNGGTATVNGLRLLQNGQAVYSVSGLSETVSGSAVKTFALDNRQTIGFDLPQGVSVITSTGGYVGQVGDEFSFTLRVAPGYRASDAMQVFHNGRLLVPTNGVYTFEVANATNTVSVSGVLPTTVRNVNMWTYNSGFETYGSEFIFMPQFDNSEVPACAQHMVNGNFTDITFRITVGGVTYEVVPDSNYNFGSSSLYRLPVASKGWIPQNGTSYNVKVEVCYKNVPIFKDDSIQVTCNATASGYSTHTHSYTGACVAVEPSTCTTAGTGYRRCSRSGCGAMQACTLPLDPSVHTYGSEPVVTKNATHAVPGELSFVCSGCGATHFVGYIYADPTDVNDDGVVDITDVSCVLNLLSTAGADRTDSVCDVNKDGICSIRDVTYLLLVLQGVI